MIENRRGQAAIGIVAILFFAGLLMLFAVLGVSLKFSVVIIGACLIFFISFINTDVALIILIFSMLLSPEFNTGAVPGRAVVIRADDIFIIVIFFGWLAKMAINKDLGLLRATPLNAPLLAYIVICIVSSGVGVLQGTNNPKYSFFYILKYIEYFMVFFMVSNNINNKKQIRLFLYFLLFTCLIVSIYASTVYSPAGMRATAPFEGKQGEPNTLAGYLIIMMSTTLGLFLYSSSPNWHFLFGSLLAFFTLPFIYTLSRSGWISLLPAYFTFLVFSERNKTILILLLAVMIAIGPFIFSKEVVARFKTILPRDRTYTVMGGALAVDESAWLRAKSWEASLKMWSDYPILGQGVPGRGAVSDVQYTRVLREVGIVGFLIFIWMLIVLFKMGFRAFTDPKVDNFGKGLSLGFVSALVGLLVMGIGAEVFIIIRIMEPFWFLAAIVTVLPEVTAEEEAAAG